MLPTMAKPKCTEHHQLLFLFSHIQVSPILEKFCFLTYLQNTFFFSPNLQNTVSELLCAVYNHSPPPLENVLWHILL